MEILCKVTKGFLKREIKHVQKYSEELESQLGYGRQMGWDAGSPITDVPM